MWPFNSKEGTGHLRAPLQAGDWVLFYTPDEKTFLVQLKTGGIFHTHKGIIKLDECIGLPYGSLIECPHTTVMLLEPTVEDYMMKVKRRTNIIYPKDASLILIKSGIHAGSRVVEIGTGSGSMVIALAHTVAPTGKVYAYDTREEFLKLSEKNLSRCKDVKDCVEFKVKEENAPIIERDIDCVTMDIPVPWAELANAKVSLKPGGRIVALNPTYNQIEKMAQALRDEGFIMINAVELLLRPILARTGKTRPVQHMIGHTEILLFATKAPEKPVTSN